MRTIARTSLVGCAAKLHTNDDDMPLFLRVHAAECDTLDRLLVTDALWDVD